MRPPEAGRLVSEEQKIDPKHSGRRRFFRVVGPLTALTGVVLVGVSIATFFSGDAFAYTWCPFVGMPLIFIGGVMSMFGYAGAVARYQAAEIAPVGKDAFNYMARGTADGVKTMASALGAGLAEGMGGAGAGGGARQPATVVRCHKCNADNDADARFCNQCGAALVKSTPCPACGELNDPDARFCDNCGRAMR